MLGKLSEKHTNVASRIAELVRNSLRKDKNSFIFCKWKARLPLYTYEILKCKIKMQNNLLFLLLDFYCWILFLVTTQAKEVSWFLRTNNNLSRQLTYNNPTYLLKSIPFHLTTKRYYKANLDSKCRFGRKVGIKVQAISSFLSKRTFLSTWGFFSASNEKKSESSSDFRSCHRAKATEWDWKGRCAQ